MYSEVIRKISEYKAQGNPHLAAVTFDLVRCQKNLNFLVKTKNVPKGLKCKINPNFFLIRGPPFGKNSQIISIFFERAYLFLVLYYDKFL